MAKTAQLHLRIKRSPVPVDMASLANITSLHHACIKCAEAASLQDKTLALDTGIDPGVWSRIKQGDAGISGEFLDRLMDAAGNELPLLWLLHSRGYDATAIRKRESELETQLREARAELAAERNKNSVIAEFMGKVRLAA